MSTDVFGLGFAAVGTAAHGQRPPSELSPFPQLAVPVFGFTGASFTSSIGHVSCCSVDWLELALLLSVCLPFHCCIESVVPPHTEEVSFVSPTKQACSPGTRQEFSSCARG